MSNTPAAGLVFTEEQMTFALQGLLPRGRVWPRDVISVQTAVIAAMAKSFARLTQDAAGLIEDAFPVAPVFLLPEWEASLGLPDPCAGPQPSLQQRQQQVFARFTDGGGQSAAYFIAFAATLGFTITVSKFGPACAGRCTAGMPLYGASWINAWAVHAPLNTIIYARAGVSAAGDPLASWGNDVLECEIRARAPAHSTVLFDYA